LVIRPLNTMKHAILFSALNASMGVLRVFTSVMVLNFSLAGGQSPIILHHAQRACAIDVDR
jgi:hypothetical protein